MKIATSIKGPAKKTKALTIPRMNWPFAQEENSTPAYDSELRRQMIATTAYFRAMQRGFEAGHETEDWFMAEAEIDNVIGNAVPNIV